MGKIGRSKIERDHPCDKSQSHKTLPQSRISTNCGDYYISIYAILLFLLLLILFTFLCIITSRTVI